MNIVESTERYETWLANQMPLNKSDLEFKHQQMATTGFAFFRATYYRWGQRWEKVSGKAGESAKVLAVGDLHVENFGTWRDLEGRLVWGVNDFDEAIELPYTNDLIRLATSAALAIREERLKFDLREACDAILDGYSKSLEAGGQPFVLEENHPELREMATSSLRNPDQFWKKMAAMPEAAGADVAEAVTAIGNLLPVASTDRSVRARRAGLGSLGRPRYVVLAQMEGGLIAREAKRMTASATCWAEKRKGPCAVQYQTILDKSVRCNDPLVRLSDNWLVRRLAPHCTRISLEDWPKERAEIHLIRAMGFETANVHQSKKKSRVSIMADLKDRPNKWLIKSATVMADLVEEEAGEWRAHVKA